MVHGVTSSLIKSEIEIELDPARRRSDDVVQPFMIEASGLAGRLVRLGAALDEILARHDLPESVARLLGEFLALGATLAAALKYSGVFSLQTKSDGPVPMMVADITDRGDMRAYAQVKGTLPDDGAAASGPVPALLGPGYLAFTVDQSAKVDRYQGLVSLEGATLVECLDHYFAQSQQFDSSLLGACGKDSAGRWRAAAIMLQRLPQEGGRGGSSDDEDWNRAVTLMGSATRRELLDPQITPDRLLYRLFHEDGVRVFEPRPLAARCRCSRERMLNVLAALRPEEIADVAVDGVVETTCEFCSTTRRFTPAEIAAVRTMARA